MVSRFCLPSSNTFVLLLVNVGKNQPRKTQKPTASTPHLCLLFYFNEFYLRNRSAPAVNCFLIIHGLEVSCKEDQITSL